MTDGTLRQPWLKAPHLAWGTARTFFAARRQELCVVATVAFAYFLMFATFRNASVPDAFSATLNNVTSLVLTAVVTRPLVRRALGLNPALQALAHGLLALIFSFGWLWLLTVGAGLLGARSAMSFTVAPFLIHSAERWQLFQGIFVYGLFATLLALQRRPSASGGVVVVNDVREVPATQHLVRVGEHIVPLMASRIVAIRGADDYAEVVTLDTCLLVQTRLTEFEARLDPAIFVRVHRSAIINLNHVVRAEPVGGGRMSLELAAGSTVLVSRAGARALRERLL